MSLGWHSERGADDGDSGGDEFLVITADNDMAGGFSLSAKICRNLARDLNRRLQRFAHRG